MTTEQEIMKFENMMLDDQTSWWPCSKNEDGKMYLSVGTILHFLYMYGTFDMAERSLVGDGAVTYHGEEIATFEMSEKYKIPVFKFISKYKELIEMQDIFLRGIDNGLHTEWRKKMNHLSNLLKINF